MNIFKLIILALAGAASLALNAAAQPAPPRPEDNPANQPSEEDSEPIQVDRRVLEGLVKSVLEGMSTNQDHAGPGESYIKPGSTSPRFVPPMKKTAGTPESAFDDTSLPTNSTPAANVLKDGEKGLRLNFRGAPLDLVLDYLSDAAGFIIVPEVDVRGKVDVWSNQPLTKEEAIELLNKVLAKEGYAVLRDDRTLTIVTQTEAKRRNETPVKYGFEPSSIPKDQQVVTQIIPVRFINAVQLAKDLQPLMPSQTTMTANEGGNALVLTDTQQNIHRMAEIIKALDTTVSSLSSVKVFSLRFADAKAVAEIVKEVFANSDGGRSGGSGGGRGRGEFRFGGGPFAAMFGGGSESGGTGRPGASRVVATADERSNSLVVSAPEDLMPTIEELVKSVDTNVDDLTEIRVFGLKFADPQETADLITSLFPDPTSTQNSQRGGGFSRFFRGADTGSSSGSQPSDRAKKQSKVIAAPDNRTRSVAVTATRDTMEQISKMITQLDSDPARKQKVFVFDVQNTDPSIVQQTLDDLFSGQGTSSSRSRATGQAGSQLNTRASQQNQNPTTRTSTRTSGTTGSRSFGN